MTVTNHSATDSTILAKGTIFVSSAGERYKSVAATPLPAARRTRAGRRVVVTPSETSLWVQALRRGAPPTIRRVQQFTIEGTTGPVAAGIKASAYSITLDEQSFWGLRKSYIFDPATERYEAVSNMNMARWYPSLVRLANGKVLAVSGLDQFGRIITATTKSGIRRPALGASSPPSPSRSQPIPPCS